MTGVTQKIADKRANDRQVGGDHYATEDGIQHWDLFGPDYLIGYATKYMRWRKKGGVEDLEKAIHVVEKLREVVTEENLPRYDFAKVLLWQNAVGLDFVERTIVNKIMFMRGRSDLDVAIEGIRYLIEQSKPIVDPIADGSGINYLTLDQYSPETLRFEMNRLKRANDASRGWGAAVGARLESIKEIESELARRERRVPRFGAEGGHVRGPLAGEGRSLVEMLTPDAGHPPHMVLSPGVTVEDKAERLATMYGDGGSQHSSLFPWKMSKDKWQATFAGRIEHAQQFYVARGVENKMLDAAVSTSHLPRELEACYNLHRVGYDLWIIKIERVPAELREDYPYLERELNKVEMSTRPFWQSVLYKWEEETDKYVLNVEAWAKD